MTHKQVADKIRETLGAADLPEVEAVIESQVEGCDNATDFTIWVSGKMFTVTVMEEES